MAEQAKIYKKTKIAFKEFKEIYIYIIKEIIYIMNNYTYQPLLKSESTSNLKKKMCTIGFLSIIFSFMVGYTISDKLCNTSHNSTFY